MSRALAAGESPNVTRTAPWPPGSGGRHSGVDSQADLDAVAAELNGRPRETLGRRSPAERFFALAGAG